MENQQDLIKTISYLEDKAEYNIEFLTCMERLLDNYNENFLEKCCQEMIKEIDNDGTMDKKEKNHTKKLFRYLMDDGKGISKLTKQYQDLKISIQQVQQELIENEYESRNKAIQKSIISRLVDLESHCPEQQNMFRINHYGNMDNHAMHDGKKPQQVQVICLEPLQPEQIDLGHMTLDSSETKASF